MKKFALILTVAITMATGSVAKAEAGDTLLLYIPNRIVDFADMFSITLGFGPAIGIEGQCTQYLAIGGDAGPTAQMIKGINRQYGFAKQSGWDVSFLMVGAENRERQGAIGSVKDYYYYSTGVPSMEKVPYDFHNGSLDFWAVGGKLICLFEVQAYLHPVEIADFLLGIVFIDIKDDDFTGDDIKQ